MNESEFQEIAEQTIEDIQNAIDNSGADIDYDEIGVQNPHCEPCWSTIAC